MYGIPSQPFTRLSTQAALVAVFAGISLGTNYALIGVPNVKLMDVFVFLASFLFGLRIGIGVAASIWTIYGFVNPYGQDDLILLSFLIVGECFYAIAGTLVRRAPSTRNPPSNRGDYHRMSIIFATAGVLSTLAYDVLTNFASLLFKTSSLYNSLVLGLITGAPFALVHELSNLVFFATAAPAAILAARKLGYGILVGSND